MIGLTLFPSLYSKEGTFHACNESALCRWLARPTEYPDKHAAKRWGAFRSQNGRRRKEDIAEIFAVVLDVDDAPVATQEQLADALGDLHAVMFSTYSATPRLPRWRGGPFAFSEMGGAAFDVAAALKRFPEEHRIEAPTPRIKSTSRYARAALASAVAEVRSAQRGARNATLNRAAFPIARFVQTGELAEETVIAALVAAAISTGMPRREALYTVRRSIRERARRSA